VCRRGILCNWTGRTKPFGVFKTIRKGWIRIRYKACSYKVKPPFCGGFTRTFCSVVSGFFRDNWILNLTLVFFWMWIWFFNWILSFGFWCKSNAAFVGKKLKGFKWFVLFAEAVFYATEQECRNTHCGVFKKNRQRRIQNTPQGMILQNKTPVGTGVCNNVVFLW
jgi:hypothetical protein